MNVVLFAVSVGGVPCNEGECCDAECSWCCPHSQCADYRHDHDNGCVPDAARVLAGVMRVVIPLAVVLCLAAGAAVIGRHLLRRHRLQQQQQDGMQVVRTEVRPSDALPVMDPRSQYPPVVSPEGYVMYPQFQPDGRPIYPVCSATNVPVVPAGMLVGDNGQPLWPPPVGGGVIQQPVVQPVLVSHPVVQCSAVQGGCGQQVVTGQPLCAGPQYPTAPAMHCS